MVGKRVESQPGVKLAGWPPALNHNPKFYALKDQGMNQPIPQQGGLGGSPEAVVAPSDPLAVVIGGWTF